MELHCHIDAQVLQVRGMLLDFKGKKMPGRMGGKQRTVKNVWVYKIDPARNLMWVRGQLPGNEGNFVFIKDAWYKKPDVSMLPFPTYFSTEDEDVTCLEPLIFDLMKCESWQVPYTQVSIFVRDYVVFQLLEVVRVWRSIAVAVCTEYGPKKEKQIRKPKPPLSRVRFFLEKEMFRNKVNSRGFVAAKSKVGSTEMDAKWDLLWLFLLLMDWVTSGDCKQDLNWQLGLNGQYWELRINCIKIGGILVISGIIWEHGSYGKFRSWSDYMGFMVKGILIFLCYSFGFDGIL
ncbi:hypothetical protein LXL04_022668 [Taraxacum kok-saghyz]